MTPGIASLNLGLMSEQPFGLLVCTPGVGESWRNARRRRARVRLKACQVREVKVLSRHTLSGLKRSITASV